MLWIFFAEILRYWSGIFFSRLTLKKFGGKLYGANWKTEGVILSQGVIARRYAKALIKT